MKRKWFAFWICGCQECQKNLSSQKTIHNHLQNSPKICDHSSHFLCGRLKWITPYAKTCCQYNIILFKATIWKWVKTWRLLAQVDKTSNILSIFLQTFDFCHLTNTKLVFFQVNLLIVEACLNRTLFTKTICLWHKSSIAKVTKINKIARYGPSHLFKNY